jgi:hypothetical protein
MKRMENCRAVGNTGNSTMSHNTARENMLKPRYKPQVDSDNKRAFLKLRNTCMVGAVLNEETAINTAVVPAGDHCLFIKF